MTGGERGGGGPHRAVTRGDGKGNILLRGHRRRVAAGEREESDETVAGRVGEHDLRIVTTRTTILQWVERFPLVRRLWPSLGVRLRSGHAGRSRAPSPSPPPENACDRRPSPPGSRSGLARDHSRHRHAMGRRHHGERERPRAPRTRDRAARDARHSARGAHRLRAPHARLDVRVRGLRRVARARGHHRRGGRRGASPRHGRLEDAASGARRPGAGDAAQRARRAALHRPDAEGRPRRHARHRQARRGERGAPRGAHPLRPPPRGPRPAAPLARRSDGGGPARGGAGVTAVLPGGTIGILGGGQLGRITALAAHELGYRVHVLDPDAACAASPVVERVLVAPFDDADAAAELARGVDVVTLEIEKIPGASLEAAARHAPLRPAAEVLRIVRDRATQKEWLAAQGFPLGDFRVARDGRALAAAAAAFGDDCFAKLTVGGYDGRGQLRITSRADAEGAWSALGAAPCVVERAVPLAAELSVMVARRPAGEIAVYPPAWNHASARILDWSVIPADVDPATAREAERIGRALALALDVEGLLAVELF